MGRARHQARSASDVGWLLPNTVPELRPSAVAAGMPAGHRRRFEHPVDARGIVDYGRWIG